MHRVEGSANVSRCLRLRMALGASLVALIAPGFAQSATYYLKSGGNDNSCGTSAGSAWKTLDRVNEGPRGTTAPPGTSECPTNPTHFQPGDTIQLKGGQTFSGTLSLTPSNANTGTGTGGELKIQSYSSGRATITPTTGTYEYGRSPYSTGTFTNSGIKLVDVGGFRITNINVFGVLSGGYPVCAGEPWQLSGYGVGIDIYTTLPTVTLNHFYIDNVEVKQFCHGIVIEPAVSATSKINDINVDAANVHDIGTAADEIKRGGNGVAFLSPTGAFDNPQISNASLLNSSISNTGTFGVLALNCEHCTFQSNTVLDTSLNFVETGGTEAGSYAFEVDGKDVLIEGNTIGRNQSAPSGSYIRYDNGGLNAPIEGGTIQYNYIYDSGGANLQLDGHSPSSGQYKKAKDLTIRYNILVNRNQTTPHSILTPVGIMVWDDVSDTVFYNNTIYNDNSSAGIKIVSYEGAAAPPTNVRFYNNVIRAINNPVVQAVTYDGQTATLAFSINNYYRTGSASDIDWYGSGSTISAWGQDSGALTADPLLVNPGTDTKADYKLQSTSMMRDAGLDLRCSPYSLSVGSQDAFALAIPSGSAFDVGAHEYPNGAGGSCSGGTILQNGTFESGALFPYWVSYKTGTLAATIATGSGAHAGSYGVYIPGVTAFDATGVYQTVSGLTIGLTYTLTCWLMTGSTDDAVVVGVDGPGLAWTTSDPWNQTSWGTRSIPFVATATTANVWIFRDEGMGTGSAWADDCILA